MRPMLISNNCFQIAFILSPKLYQMNFKLIMARLIAFPLKLMMTAVDCSVQMLGIDLGAGVGYYHCQYQYWFLLPPVSAFYGIMLFQELIHGCSQVQKHQSSITFFWRQLSTCSLCGLSDIIVHRHINILILLVKNFSYFSPQSGKVHKLRPKYLSREGRIKSCKSRRFWVLPNSFGVVHR